ncbi:MAG: DNA cytosine methyltransferase [Acidimicrobiia bacterium]|nr:DNA cytosine methyltransferase [Acidimicrobiia bacterium]
MTQRYTVVSLFSGAMGLDIGLEGTGRFQTLAAVEKEPAFCDTIRLNRDQGGTAHEGLVVVESDVGHLCPEDLMARLGLEAGEVDLLVGGPPCQAFSTSGRRASVQDPRGTLLWDFLRFVAIMRPKYFLMENVRGLMSAALRHRPIHLRPEKGGPALDPDEMPGSVLRLFLEDLQGDYRLDIFEVNAANYGAPQIRERVLFFGNRVGDLIEFPAPTHGVPKATKSDNLTLFSEEGGLAESLLPFRTLGEALEGLVEEDPVTLDFSPRKKSFLAMVPPGSNWRALPPEVAELSMGRAYHAKGGRSGWWRRLSMDLPSPTIVTMPNHASTALCHPTETRALTLRECARIQEFPDEWEFVGRPVEQFAQVGNAVPVRLGQVAGQVLADRLDSLEMGRALLVGDKLPPVRQVYLQSHIRTRRWYKDGTTYIRGTECDTSSDYGPPRTTRKETVRGS